MNWKDYIEGRKWYRGTLATEDPKRRRKKTTFWLPSKEDAKGYADPRRFNCKPMQLITAKIEPSKLFIGNEPALARKVGVWGKYLRLVEEGKKWEPETDKLVNNAARKAGYDVQAIAKDQLQVFSPKAIRVLKSERIKVPKSRCGIGYTNRSGTKFSRQSRRGFKKVRFT